MPAAACPASTARRRTRSVVRRAILRGAGCVCSSRTLWRVRGLPTHRVRLRRALRRARHGHDAHAILPRARRCGRRGWHAPDARSARTRGGCQANCADPRSAARVTATGAHCSRATRPPDRGEQTRGAAAAHASPPSSRARARAQGTHAHAASARARELPAAGARACGACGGRSHAHRHGATACAAARGAH